MYTFNWRQPMRLISYIFCILIISWSSYWWIVSQQMENSIINWFNRKHLKQDLSFDRITTTGYPNRADISIEKFSYNNFNSHLSISVELIQLLSLIYDKSHLINIVIPPIEINLKKNQFQILGPAIKSSLKIGSGTFGEVNRVTLNDDTTRIIKRLINTPSAYFHTIEMENDLLIEASLTHSLNNDYTLQCIDVRLSPSAELHFTDDCAISLWAHFQLNQIRPKTALLILRDIALALHHLKGFQSSRGANAFRPEGAADEGALSCLHHNAAADGGRDGVAIAKGLAKHRHIGFNAVFQMQPTEGFAKT